MAGPSSRRRRIDPPSAVDTEQGMTVTCPPPSVATGNPHRGAKDINAVWGLGRLLLAIGRDATAVTLDHEQSSQRFDREGCAPRLHADPGNCPGVPAVLVIARTTEEC